VRINRGNRYMGVVLAAGAAVGAPLPAWGQEAADDQEEARRDERGSSGSSSDVVVTGRSLEVVETPLPVQVLAGDELAHRRQGGLGETLAGLPGVHLDNFGGGASRPVIRGQTVPRIEILSDGANLFDVSSVSPDHAITTDPLLLDGIEIQRGPAATRYGGNATNGAINLIDSKVPKSVPAGGLTGATEVRYGTGDEEKTVVGRITAGVGQFALHAEGARRAAEDYAVPDRYGSDRLRDSFAESTSYSVGASWVTAKGYIGAAYSRMESEYGLPRPQPSERRLPYPWPRPALRGTWGVRRPVRRAGQPYGPHQAAQRACRHPCRLRRSAAGPGACPPAPVLHGLCA
jgi:iron complex outermembrane receptor protein